MQLYYNSQSRAVVAKWMLGGASGRPKLEAYVDRLMARPAAKKMGA